MVTNEQLAVFAFRAYRPSDDNDLPLTGWTLHESLSRPNRGAGFDGSVFYAGNSFAPSEIVIAFRGTDEFPSIDWPLGNLPAAAGYDWGQVYRAIELVADTMAEYPGVTITLTGHSLGGGLASLMATFFDLDAHTFDTAPFELSAIGAAAYPVLNPSVPIQLFPTDLVEAFFAHYDLYQRRNGRANQISTAFESYRDVLDSENRELIDALFAQREAGITGSYLSGEVLVALRELLPTIVSPAAGALHEIDVGVTTLSGVKLHSMLLLTAMMVSSKLAQASRQQIGLAELLLDETLYARDKLSNEMGFLNRLIAQQMNEGAAPGAGILDRFADDVIRLGTAGTSNHVLMRDALIAVIIERYRFVNPADATAFVSTAPNSVTFDPSDLLGVGRARLLDAVVALANSILSAQVRSAAEAATQWRIHSGTVALATTGLSANEVQIGSLIHSNYLRGGAGNDLLINGNAGGTLEGGENDDVLVGGTAGDTLSGGAGRDYIDGSGGADSLIGGAGSDELYGGAGADNYNFFLGDGSDTIFDSDGLGAIYVEGVQVQVGTRTGENTWMSSNGQLTITRLPGGGPGAVNLNSLIIRDAAGTLNITVRHLDDGDLGLALNDDDYPEAGETSGDIVPPSPTSTWPPPSSSSGTGSVTSYLDYTNLFGSTGIDRLFGLVGNDGLVGGDNDDYMDGGDGRDLLFGGSGRDFLSGGEGGDFIVGDGGSVTLGGQVGSQQGQVYIPLTSQVVYNGLGWGVELIGTTHLVNGATAFYAAGAADSIDAGAGDDYVWSGDGDDVIGGGDGIDTIIGGAGNDNAQGGADNDVIIGDGQRDDVDPDSDFNYSTITAQGQDVLLGGQGNDYLVGGGNADRLYGEDGNDTLRGDHQAVWPVAPALQGDDLLDGGAGEDLLVGDGGNDTLSGGEDRDILFGDADATGLAGQYHGVDVINGDGGNDDMKGGGGADQLFGGTGNDLIFGDEDSGGAAALGAQYQGNDLIDGGAGLDTAYGGGGADRVFGGTGNDILFGDRFVGAAAHGDDYIDGGDDDDTIVGDGGADTLLGGAGADHIEGDNVASIAPLAVHGNDYIDGGSGQDTVYGWGGDDRILGGSDTDYLTGDAQIGALEAAYHGDDHISGGDGIDYIWGMGGDDTLFGDAGDNEIDGDDFDVTALAGNDYIDGGLGNDRMWGRGGNDVLVGGLGNDFLFGNDGNDQLSGDDGNDQLNGGAGDDVLSGGSGADIIDGGDGADIMDGGAGNDTFYGGAGDDTYILHSDGGTDTIYDSSGVSRIIFDGTVIAANLYLDVSHDSTRNLIVRYSDRDSLRLDALQVSSTTVFETEEGTTFSYQMQVGTGGNDTMVGTSGWDLLMGEQGSDTLSGGAGNDTLFGGAGGDTLSGGAGADMLIGGGGSDNYIFNLGDGRDVIREGDPLGVAGWDGITFGADITYSDLSFVGVGNDVIITIQGTSDTIVLDNWFSGEQNPDRIDQLIFANEVPVTIGAGLVSTNTGTNHDDSLVGDATAAVTLAGLMGNDRLYGGAASETLDGGYGNDNLQGGAGNDTYLFRRGEGQDSITESSGTDRIVFEGINRADVTFERAAADLIIRFNGTQDQIRVTSFWGRSGSGVLEQLVFADGARTGAREIYELGLLPPLTNGDDSIDAGPANNTISGLDGSDNIRAGAGNDTVSGDGGNDNLSGSFGSDVLSGGAGNDSLDGAEQNDQLSGGDGNDSLAGGSGDDVLDGGAGNDGLLGGHGSDTYLFDLGSGQDSIGADTADRIVFGAGISTSSLVFSRSSDNLVIAVSGTSDRITIGNWFRDAGRRFEQFEFADGSSLPPIETIYRSLLTYSGTSGGDIMYGIGDGEILHGMGGSDSIFGYGGDDVLDGGDGNDQLYADDGFDQLFGGAGDDSLRGHYGDLLDGGAGNDSLYGFNGTIYVFGRGYGQDTISSSRSNWNEHSAEGSLERITFTAGTTAADIIATRSGNNLVLTIAGTTDTLAITGWFTAAANRVHTIEFADGTRLASPQEITDSLLTQIPPVGTSVSGTTGNDTMTGAAAVETLYGLQGDDALSGLGGDLLVGGTGNDTYLYNRGSGQVAIYDYDLADAQSGSAVDRVVFGADITASDISLGRTMNDLVLTINDGTDRLTVRNWFSGASYQVQFVFSDSSALPTAAEIYTSLLSRTGTSAAETISGFEGNESISGGAGNDIIYGGLGNDALSGGDDWDRMYGEWGDDVLTGGAGNDTLYGYEGNDALYGGSEFDTLSGGAGNDTLDGGGMDGQTDSLTGGAGDDIYIFGRGYGVDSISEVEGDSDDHNIVRFGAGVSASDIVIWRDYNDLMLSLAGSTDALELSQWFADADRPDITFEFQDGSHLPTTRQIEQLVLTHVGDNLENTIIGADGNETISGLGGNDTLSGDNGSDVLHGGDGNDTLKGDSSYGGTLDLTFHGDDLIYGEAGDDSLNGWAGNDLLDGGTGDDTLVGGAGSDTYIFALGYGRDSIDDYNQYDVDFYTYGFTDDRIVFGTGIRMDRMLVTRIGNDLGVRINDADRLTITGWFLGNTVEQFQFADGTVLNSTQLEARIGAVLDNGAPTLVTPLADFTTAEDSLFTYQIPLASFSDPDAGDSLTFTASSVNSAALPSWLTFDAATRTFSGTPLNADAYSFDVLLTATDAIGASVSDVFTIAVTNVNDAPQLASPIYDMQARESNWFNWQVPAGQFYDVDSSTLVYEFELEDGSVLPSWLVFDPATRHLSGTPAPDDVGTLQIRLRATDDFGASVSDVFSLVVASSVLEGTEFADTLNSDDLVHRIFGHGGDDILNGYGGDDLLDGGTGNDTLRGHTGNDTYVVDSLSDNIAESSNQGTDTVRSSITWTLANNFENLVLTGTDSIAGIGNAVANSITGNSGNNAINGGGGADTLAGGGGNDTYTVDNVGDTVSENGAEGIDLVTSGVSYTLAEHVENLTLSGTLGNSATGNALDNVLTGNGGNNTLTGGGGNDTINGGSGTDTMLGGQGNDTYVVAQTADIVTEAANEGIDLVQATATFTLSEHVENLTLSGSSQINGTGNGLDNILIGNGVVNTLTGNGGNDTLNGGGGADIMAGGEGNDIYYVDVTNDQSNENAGQGIDVVNSSIARTLAANIELLFLTGASNIAGTGNTLSNLIRGNQGNNTVAGGGGLDILEGGVGGDVLSNTSGNTLLNGGAGADTLTGTSANDLLIGGIGNDALTTGQGADIIVFNRGDGQDTVAASTTRDNTVSLGGGGYADLLFRKNNNDLILQVGASDQITFTGYYSATTNQSVNTLQIVIEGTSDYVPGSGDVMRDNKLETFNFEGLVAAFDQARAANPSLTNWALTNALLVQHLGGSDTAAIGGDLAYRYARFGSIADISFTPAIGILGAAGFGTSAQTLQSLASLQDASPRLS